MRSAEGELYEALDIMANRQDVVRDTHGNVSARTSRGMYIKPSGVPYEDIDDVVFVDGTELTMLEQSLRPSVDWPHHLSIYERHPWIGGICHVHSPHATSFAIRNSQIRCRCTEHADYFGHDIRCLPYASLDEWGYKVVLAENEKAVLLAHHGVLTFGSGPVEAVKLAIALENIAEKMNYALMIGGPLPDMLDDVEVAKWHERYTKGYGQVK